MRRYAPLLVLLILVLAACSSTPGENAPPPVDPTDMGRPLDLERAKLARDAAPQVHEQDAQSSSRVLAYVSGDVITNRDVLLRVGPQLAVLGETAERSEIEQEALLDILRDRVVYYAALEAGVEISRGELEGERTRFVRDLERNGGTLPAYLAERGMTRREFDEELRRGRITQLYLRGAMGLNGGDPRVRPMIDTFVAPGEVKAYWERHPEQFHEAGYASIRMMTIRPDRNASDARRAVREAKAKAERARARLAAGEDWVPVYRETVPAAAVEDPYGLIELRRGDKAEWIESFAFDSPRGRVSELIEKGRSFYVMQAEGAHAERTIPYEEVRDLLRVELGQRRRQVGQIEVALKLLERASVRPAQRMEDLRGLLRNTRLRLLEQYGL